MLIFSLVVPAIFDPIAYLYLFSQQMNIGYIHTCIHNIIIDLKFNYDTTHSNKRMCFKPEGHE